MVQHLGKFEVAPGASPLLVYLVYEQPVWVHMSIVVFKYMASHILSVCICNSLSVYNHSILVSSYDSCIDCGSGVSRATQRDASTHNEQHY